jgi:hypothetical protein
MGITGRWRRYKAEVDHLLETQKTTANNNVQKAAHCAAAMKNAPPATSQKSPTHCYTKTRKPPTACIAASN